MTFRIALISLSVSFLLLALPLSVIAYFPLKSEFPVSLTESFLYSAPRFILTLTGFWLLLIPLAANLFFHRRFVAIWNTVLLLSARFAMTYYLNRGTDIFGQEWPNTWQKIVSITMWVTPITIMGFIVSSLGRFVSPIRAIQENWEKTHYVFRLVAYITMYIFIISLTVFILSGSQYISEIYSQSSLFHKPASTLSPLFYPVIVLAFFGIVTVLLYRKAPKNAEKIIVYDKKDYLYLGVVFSIFLLSLIIGRFMYI